MSNRGVAEALGGLPPAKMHCSNLAADALHLAIKDYIEKHGAEGSGIDPDSIVVEEHDHGDEADS
mgnify:FL=1